MRLWTQNSSEGFTPAFKTAIMNHAEIMSVQSSSCNQWIHLRKQRKFVQCFQVQLWCDTNFFAVDQVKTILAFVAWLCSMRNANRAFTVLPQTKPDKTPSLQQHLFCRDVLYKCILLCDFQGIKEEHFD